MALIILILLFTRVKVILLSIVKVATTCWGWGMKPFLSYFRITSCLKEKIFAKWRVCVWHPQKILRWRKNYQIHGSQKRKRKIWGHFLKSRFCIWILLCAVRLKSQWHCACFLLLKKKKDNCLLLNIVKLFIEKFRPLSST